MGAGPVSAARNRLVPTIDIIASGDRAAVGAELDAACREVGFFEVVGHGMPATVIDAMQAATAEFFALPEATKRATKPADLEVNRGYSARATEGLGYSIGVARPPDLFEAFNIGPDAPDLADPAVAAEQHRLFAANVWPAEVPALRPSPSVKGSSSLMRWLSRKPLRDSSAPGASCQAPDALPIAFQVHTVPGSTASL